ncbi:MAG: Tex-like N-terminal domain-containing protein, partial [Clostridia bacterium]
MTIEQQLLKEFSIKPEHLANIIAMLDEGNTIPFIARYRKEMTGACDDQVLRELSERLTYIRNIEKRKLEVASSIQEQGKWTDEIAIALQNANLMVEVEDIYRPYKQKRKTRASVAKDMGLEPLAKTIFDQVFKGDILEEATKYMTAENG